MTWPPRWDGPQFKHRGSAKVARGKKRLRAAAFERGQKDLVRDRDKTCRFPLCGCKRFGLALHVSHSQHKGMGGNPTGDRSAPSRMVLVCSARHRENIVSIDQGTLCWVPLTDKGADGPIAWMVPKDTVVDGVPAPRSVATWVCIAREVSVRSWEPFTRAQKLFLQALAEMED